jgi:hypothetical protein
LAALRYSSFTNGILMQPVAHTLRRPRLALAAMVVLAACATAPQLAAPPRMVAPPLAEPAVAPAPEPAPIAARAPLVEESEVGDHTGFTPGAGPLPTPALEALGASPTPEALAAVHPPEAAAPAPSAEPESLLTSIGPKTPPNVAAALRLIEEGRQQLAQERYDRALDRFERGVAIDPTNAYGYYFLAQLHFLMKKYDQASAFASRAVTLAMRTDHVWLARAYGLQAAVFEEVGRYADARKAYQKAVAADPNNLAARVGVGRLSSGR